MDLQAGTGIILIYRNNFLKSKKIFIWNKQ